MNEVALYENRSLTPVALSNDTLDAYMQQVSAIPVLSVEEERAIRAGQGGLLNVQGRALLPADPSAEEEECDATQRGFHCFLAGHYVTRIKIIPESRASFCDNESHGI